MTSSIILTHCGKLGDFLYCLPVASWLAKTRGVKIHFVLPRCFPPFHHITPLLHSIPFTEQVSLVSHPIRDFQCGGQPYRFDPAQYGIEGEYFNLGIRSYPNKFMPAFVAEEHGFDWDRDFKLNFGPVEPSGKILCSEQPEVHEAVPHAEGYHIPIDLLELGRQLAAAKERHLWFSGPACLMHLARIPFHLHWTRGHPIDQHVVLEGAEFTAVEYVRKKR